MAEDNTAELQERQALRRQLLAVGWTAGEQTKRIAGHVRLALWPVPHTGPAEGVEPRWVEGVNRTDALRNAVRELAEQPTPEES